MRKILIGWFILMAIKNGNAAPAIPCATLHDAWTRIASDFGADFSLNERCGGISGKFATAAYLLKAHFPSTYTHVIGEIGRTIVTGGKDTFVAYAEPLTQTMSLYPRYANSTTEFAMMVLVHEASHMEREVPSHVTCEKGANAGRRGVCDEVLDGLRSSGAYNVEVVFAVDMASYAIDHGVFNRRDIASRLNAMVSNNFNRTEGAFARQAKRIADKLRETASTPVVAEKKADARPVAQKRPVVEVERETEAVDDEDYSLLKGSRKKWESDVQEIESIQNETRELQQKLRR